MKKVYWITGASATGKTTLVNALNAEAKFIAFDIDLLRGNDWQLKKENMLRVVNHLNFLEQKNVILGTATNEQLTACKKKELFKEVELLVLTLNSNVLRERLNSRGWKEKDVQYQVDLNSKFKEKHYWQFNNVTVQDVTSFDKGMQLDFVKRWLL